MSSKLSVYNSFFIIRLKNLAEIHNREDNETKENLHECRRCGSEGPINEPIIL